MAIMISSSQKQQFAEQGYLRVEGLLDVAEDVDPFKEAYVAYLDTLAEIYLGETRPDLRSDYRARPLGERFAMLLGASGGSVLQHLDPTLSMFVPGHRWRGDLPSAQRPELFRLMRNKRLLDGLEVLLGPEITVSSIHHFNLKLTQRQMQLALRTATATGRDEPGRNPFWKFHVGRTPTWHSDASFGLPDAFNSRIINGWIPLTPATMENGCLMVSPGSHDLEPDRDFQFESMIAKATPVIAKPGDVIFLDNKMPHAALDNTSDEDIRWAFNFRYVVTGDPSGRPFLPGFVGRSRAAPEQELHDPVLWSKMWRAALEFCSTIQFPANFGHAPGEAEAITARWSAATRNYTDWLDLPSRLAL